MPSLSAQILTRFIKYFSLCKHIQIATPFHLTRIPYPLNQIFCFFLLRWKFHVELFLSTIISRVLIEFIRVIYITYIILARLNLSRDFYQIGWYRLRDMFKWVRIMSIWCWKLKSINHLSKNFGWWLISFSLTPSRTLNCSLIFSLIV